MELDKFGINFFKKKLYLEKYGKVKNNRDFFEKY